MTATLRVLIETALESMEQGQFQDFCLNFLPLYDESYIGLARFGHTAAGKTRKGTPDLIKVCEDGFQIAVQCSTDERYWAESANPAKTKPIKDVNKCFNKLTTLREIVLVSNREIPSTRPNVKAEIIAHVSDRPSVQLRLFSREDVSQFLVTTNHEPPTRKLIKDFFPQLAEVINSEEAAQKFKVSSDIASTREVDAKTLIELVSQGFQQYGTSEEARSFTVQRLDQLLQLYRL